MVSSLKTTNERVRVWARLQAGFEQAFGQGLKIGAGKVWERVWASVRAWDWASI